MEHTLNLGSKAFVEAICPTPSRYKQKTKKMRSTGNDEDIGSDSDDDEDDDELAWLASLACDTPTDNDKEVDEDMEFDPGDLLGKVLALVNQVRFIFPLFY
jgi:hypothetical protein